MKQSERPCRTCGELNESGAYACRACGVSLRLSPPKRPAPSLSPPIVAPKMSNANDTLDIETELPDQEIELLAKATPSPQAVELLDGLATLDEAADGLAPSASFDELELLAPGTNMPALSLRKEPSLQDSLTIDPLSELPKNTEILSRPKIHKSVGLSSLLAVGCAVGLGLFIAQRYSLSPQAPSSTPSVTELPSELPSELTARQGEQSKRGPVSLSLSVEELTRELSSADPAVLRAQARAWSSASAATLALTEQRALEDASSMSAQLERAEALRFEREVERLGSSGGKGEGPVLRAEELKPLSGALERLRQTDALAHRALKPWFDALSERSPQRLEPPVGADEPYQWTQALALISSAEPSALLSARALLRGARGEGCAPKLYGLRVEQLLGEQSELSSAYKGLSDCLTQLIVEARLSSNSSPLQVAALRDSSPRASKQRALKQGVKRRAARKSGTQPSGRGSFKALMSQGAKALERGQVPQAQASFKRASALKPQDPNPIAQLGWCELAARNPRGALAYFKRALSVKSDYGDALYGLGYAQERMRKWAEARAHFERYLKLYPSGAKVRIIQNKLNKMPK